MADAADRAQAVIEMERAAAIRRRREEGPEAIGECLWCQEPLPDGRRWCGPECRDAWEIGICK